MTDTAPQTLDALRLPLQGTRLIEASAGTGKTWTIAALYVRLMLGHGDGVDQGALLPGQVLVMTFTKAATRELSHRIRARLVAAAAAFRGTLPEKAWDDFLRELVAAYPGATERANAAWRLSLAAESMDDAAVFTIDAWCQRMLREHAFDSGSLFDEELQPNESALMAEAAADYWRQNVYPLDAAQTQLLLGCYADAAALAKGTRALMGESLSVQSTQSLAHALQDLIDSRRALLEGWPAKIERLQKWLREQAAAEKFPFNRTKVNPNNFEVWLAQFKTWVAEGGLRIPDKKKDGWLRFSAKHLEESRVSKGPAVPLPPECHELDALLNQLEAAPQPKKVVAGHAMAAVLERLQALKQAQRTFGFADLLQRLHAALGEPGTEAGRALRRRLREQYPVALVDEFQDTSPTQLAIFEKVYGLQAAHADRALLLIGDPKQSIYGFRGADIHSYLAARRATAGRHYALPRNFRSTHAMVAATNALFAAAEQREGEGAFRLRSAHDAGLPFHPVEAFGREDRLLVDAPGGPESPAEASGRAPREVPPLTICVDATVVSQRRSQKRYARLCALRIASWLRGENARFDVTEPRVADRAAAPRALRPADCVVLVRTGHEAAAVRRALRRLGLQSVYLSEGDSVFATPEAADLLRVLQSLNQLHDRRLARAALATQLFARHLDELRDWVTNEDTFDAAMGQLRRLHAVWQSRGVLAMVRELLHGFAVATRWRENADGLGERRLTNLLQLAELLQGASLRVEGETALVQWLATQVATGGAEAPAGGADDPQLLRLESDAELVRIITIHKSKGLEYPVVLLPFATHCREVNARNTPLVFLPETREGRAVRVPRLVPSADDLAVAERERRREDVRLLYVALTRARHAVWVGAPCVSIGNSPKCVWASSALGHLLPASNPEAGEACVAAVEAFAAQVAAKVPVAVESAAVAAGSQRCDAAQRVGTAESSEPPLLPALEYGGDFDRYWRVHSYSGVVQSATAGQKRPGSKPVATATDTATANMDPPVDDDSRARGMLDDEPDESSATAKNASEFAGTEATNATRHRYPAGAVYGDFLHKQLEWLAAEGFVLSPAVQAELRVRCDRAGHGQHAEATVEFLKEVCATPLPFDRDSAAHAPTLAALASGGALVPEMEFWMPASGLNVRQIDQLCRAHVLPGLERPALEGGALRGLMKGIMDLVFEHEGRYWVLDYKSNKLGADDATYTAEAMQQAITHHRYDVQAVLYLLALHRQLRQRLGAAYSPRQHLGGAVYFFMRGIARPERGCATLAPPWAVLEALDAALGGVA